MIYLGPIEHSSTSVVLNLPIYRSDTGQGMTGLTSASSGLSIAHSYDNNAGAVDTSAATSSIETIATLFTYPGGDPTSGFVQFKLLNDTTRPGMYQVLFEDSVFAQASSKILYISITGVTDMMDMHYYVTLDGITIADIDQALTDYTIPTTAEFEARTIASASYALETTLDGVDTLANNIEADTQDIQGRIPTALSSGGNVKADVQEINATTVVGVGTSGNKWRA